ncbi:MAG: hypothetical protein GY841_03420 [FCB group bacterium]|nr:hypothetical protein [FCB group bacterium]
MPAPTGQYYIYAIDNTEGRTSGHEKDATCLRHYNDNGWRIDGDVDG